MLESEIDTLNHFRVGALGDDIIILMPPRAPISRVMALNLAAHLVALADDKDEFPAILEAVRNT